MAISIKLIEASNNGKPITDEINFEWKRGPQTDVSKKYHFDGGEVNIGEEFQRISNFYLKKSDQTFQSKKSEFKLKVKGKTVATVPIDLVEHIGNINPPQSI